MNWGEKGRERERKGEGKKCMKREEMTTANLLFFF